MPTMLKKTYEANAEAGQAGAFTALVSVFGNVDKVGDRVVKGAFAKTLRRWKQSGDMIPVIFSHKWDDLYSHVGFADPRNVVETDRGLVVNGELDVDDNPAAKHLHRLMSRGQLKAWSFGYTVPEFGEKKAADGANDLLEVDLIEVGPTLKGANPDAETMALKSLLERAYDRKRAVDGNADPEPRAKDEPKPDRSVALLRELVAKAKEGDVDDAQLGATLERLKAEWTAAYINDLPDSSFLYVESGGSKDEDGKTVPRSLRHFPYKDADGSVDMPHLRNAAARIPQSNLPEEVKSRLARRCQQLLETNRSASADDRRTHDDPANDEQPSGRAKSTRQVDPLRRQAEAIAIDMAISGVLQ